MTVTLQREDRERHLCVPGTPAFSGHCSPVSSVCRNFPSWRTSPSNNAKAALAQPHFAPARRSLGQAPGHAANREPRADSWRWPRFEAGAFDLPAATRQDTGRPDGDGTAVIPCNWRSSSDYVTQVRSQGKNPQLAT